MSESKLETELNSTKSSSFWSDFTKFFSFTSSTEIKYCTVYTDSNTVYKYFCYKNEVCCKTGNGCCPQNASNRYLESWAIWTCAFFRICVFLIVLAMYLICWYCKKLEKSRNARLLRLAQQSRNREAVAQAQGNRTSSNNCCSRRGSAQSASDRRPSNRHTVDRLLENLIRDYRSRLGTDELPQENRPHRSSPARTKNGQREPPPRYVDALNMPRPHNRPQRLSQSRPQSSPNVSHSGRSTDEAVDRRNFVILEIGGDQRVPTYEEATRTRLA